MNLFFQKLTGKLWSTQKFEQHIAQMENEIVRYRHIEQSKELVEYKQLKEFVESADFLQKKQNYLTTKYNTTKYYQTLNELKQYDRNKQLQLYLQTLKSALLNEYLQFRESEDYIKLSDKKLVKASPDLKRMYAFERSKAFSAYQEYKNSNVPARYEELKKVVTEKQFQQENAFWANPKRWLTTDEYLKETRFKQLAATPDIIFFLSKNENDIKAMESWKITFDDEMQWTRLADTSWKPGFHYKNKALKTQHSFANEKQANNQGKNTGSINGIFTIMTKQEAITAPAWDSKKGFINKNFQYTSDIVQTADAFRQRKGLFMIKLRCNGNINHAAWLGADSQLPIVNLFHYNGKKIVVGNIGKNGFEGETVSGISQSQYFVYSLNWTDRELIFYVNNIEVYRTSNNLPTEDLYLALSSFISQQQKGQEAKLEVDWVRIYKQ